MADIDWAKLRRAAVEAMGHAYAPYSKFPVGAAALVDDGRIISGCNVENASYGLTLCAECGLVSALHASGGGRLVAFACVDFRGNVLMPCGRCRQLLWEHGGPDCLVDSPNGPVRMAELFPHPFDTTDLGRVAGAGSPVSPQSDKDGVPPSLFEYLGKGTVFVHRDVVAGRPMWTGYWERASHADEASG